MNDLVWNQHNLDLAGVIESAQFLTNGEMFKTKPLTPLWVISLKKTGVNTRTTIARVKINTDAAILTVSNLHIHAFVVRDHDGTLAEAASKCRRGNISPDLTEALSIREDLSWLKEGLQQCSS